MASGSSQRRARHHLSVDGLSMLRSCGRVFYAITPLARASKLCDGDRCASSRLAIENTARDRSRTLHPLVAATARRAVDLRWLRAACKLRLKASSPAVQHTGTNTQLFRDLGDGLRTASHQSADGISFERIGS
jgi:hypothetical protein